MLRFRVNSSLQNITVHNTLTINHSLSIQLTSAEPSHIFNLITVWGVCRSLLCSMSSMAQEILAFILTISGWVLVSSTLPTDYWQVSSNDGSVITTSTFWSNLWKTCVTDSTGVSNCRDFPSMLALDGKLFFLFWLLGLCVYFFFVLPF